MRNAALIAPLARLGEESADRPALRRRAKHAPDGDTRLGALTANRSRAAGAARCASSGSRSGPARPRGIQSRETFARALWPIRAQASGVFDLLRRYAISENGALQHAEKYFRTVTEEFAATRPAFR